MDVMSSLFWIVSPASRRRLFSLIDNVLFYGYEFIVYSGFQQSFFYDIGQAKQLGMTRITLARCISDLVKHYPTKITIPGKT